MINKFSSWFVNWNQNHRKIQHFSNLGISFQWWIQPPPHKKNWENCFSPLLYGCAITSKKKAQGYSTTFLIEKYFCCLTLSWVLNRKLWYFGKLWMNVEFKFHRIVFRPNLRFQSLGEVWVNTTVQEKSNQKYIQHWSWWNFNIKKQHNSKLDTF